MGARRKSREGPLHDPVYREMCDVLRAWRHESGLTQRELAAKLSKVHTYVAKCEQGERRVDPVELVRWTRACNVAFDAAARRIDSLVP